MENIIIWLGYLEVSQMILAKRYLHTVMLVAALLLTIDPRGHKRVVFTSILVFVYVLTLPPI